MKVPWNAPETDSRDRVHTQRGYWARRGGKYQFTIDKYEKDIMAPLTREERRLFYPGIAWFLALPFIGIGGMFVGLMLMPMPGGYGGFADWLFSNALGLIGLVAVVACWVLPVVKGVKTSAKAVKAIREAREDAFEEWRNSGHRKASNDYGDDDDDYKSERQMQHEWYGDNSDLTWHDRVMGEALGIEDGDTYKSNWL